MTLALALLLCARVDAAPVGSFFPVAPPAAPGRLPPPTTDPLALARDRYLDGDLWGVVSVLGPWLEEKKGPGGRQRAQASLLLGTAHEGLGNWNMASALYSKVRGSGGNLAPWGAFAEAAADLKRGRPGAAARGCQSYRARWEEGPHADECLMMIGDAYAAQGLRAASAGAYGQYLEKHEDTPRKEEIRLAIALAAAKSEPARGQEMLIELALDHAYPSTDLAVQAALAELRAQGRPASLPTDSPSLMRRAASLKRSGQADAAWELFGALRARAADDPEVARWVESQEDNYAGGTRNFDVLAASLVRQYEATPSAELCWEIYRAYSRGGKYPEALKWARVGMEKWASSGRWRGSREEVAWAALHAGDFAEARSRFADLGKRGTRKARFYEAFAAWRGGDAAGAEALFEALLKSGGEWQSAAHYWRARAREAQGKAELAAEDREAARKTDDVGWYTLLLDQAERQKKGQVTARPHSGRWTGEAPASLPELRRPQQSLAAAPPRAGQGPRRHAGELLAPESRPIRWAALREAPPAPSPAPAPPPGRVPQAGLLPPDGYVPGPLYDPDGASKVLLAFSSKHAGIWRDLPAAYDLAQAGLYSESARLTYAALEELSEVKRNGPGLDPRRIAISQINLPLADLRALALFTRDHYHATRSCYGLWNEVQAPEQKLWAWRLAWPIVEGSHIWALGQRWNVDPYLMMGLMRQESTYQNSALSPVGAVGLVQVMPSTGARVAALLGEPRYSPRDLEDPSTNLRYGIFYFSRLMERFDGFFPLAVASYNGGPHNMSRWYATWRGRIETDAMVEHIQYDESRDYVKKVTSNYARYVRIYEGQDAAVVLPAGPTGDDPAVINF